MGAGATCHDQISQTLHAGYIIHVDTALKSEDAQHHAQTKGNRQNSHAQPASITHITTAHRLISAASTLAAKMGTMPIAFICTQKKLDSLLVRLHTYLPRQQRFLHKAAASEQNHITGGLAREQDNDITWN